MTKKALETASFMVRFNQKIYDDNGESKVQWRGKVSHVQGGEELRFSDFNEAAAFIQERLAGLTIEATQDKTAEEQESILKKSYGLFKSFAATGPQLLKETLKDPRKQISQLQDSITGYGEELWDKVPINEWRNASKSDFEEIKDSIAKLRKTMAMLNRKIDKLSATEEVETTNGVNKASATKTTRTKK